jgi:hypothetical protein
MTGFRSTIAAAVIAGLAASGPGLEASSGAGGADRVTLRARPLVVSSSVRVTLFGSLEPGRAGEDIKIQAKDCGLDSFRVVAGAITEEGGEWSTFYFGAIINTTLRAVWRDATSEEVTIRKRASVTLRKRSGRFEVAAWGRLVWRKRVSIQYFDRRLGAWRAVKSVLLTESEPRGRALATFTVQLPKGTRIRAVFPRSQAGPCFITGTSNTLTT